MDSALLSSSADDVICIIEAVSALQPMLRQAAAAHDRDSTFPSTELHALWQCGAYTAALPRQHGGLGLGAEPGGSLALLSLLRGVGCGSLAVGRLLEGHINALRLICRYGSDGQVARAAEDAATGHLFGIWNTDGLPPVRLHKGMLSGRKANVSAATTATRAVITVDHPEHSCMLLVSLGPSRIAGPMEGRLQGMRATQPGWVDFTGYEPCEADWIGREGDYLREPEFSVGAWRTLAVILGGIDALAAELRAQLHTRGRAGAPYQAERIARCIIAAQTALLWTESCARLAEAQEVPAEGAVAYVNLARRAVEMAALSIIELVQRSLGLTTFVESNPAEHLLRDLATYLRQPALDEGLVDAASWFVAHPLPAEIAG